MEEVPIEGEIPLGGVPEIGDQPEHGTVVLTPDGKWRYTPDPGFVGKDSFTIIVTDEDGNEEEVLIEVAVEEVPKGTVTEPANGGGGIDPGLPATLPKTGEASTLPNYLIGGGLVLLGLYFARRMKRGDQAD